MNQLLNLGHKLPPELSDTKCEPPGIPAAVLAPLILPHWNSDRSEAKVLFIKRSDTLRKHAGQMAFPGGVCESDDPDLLSTGFREGLEEVGLRREGAKVLGKLPSASTPSGFSLQPYFVATTQQDFLPEPGEVQAIHLLSVEELLTCPTRIEYRSWEGREYRVVYFDTQSVCIWGVTGRILEVLLSHFFDWTPKL